MNSNSKKIFIGGGIIFTSLLAFWAYNKKSAIEGLKINVSDLKLSFKNTAMQALLFLAVKNPSTESLQFLSFTGSIYSDGQIISNLDIAKPVNIAPKATTQIQLQTTATINNIVSALMNLLNVQKLPSKCILKGVVTLTGGINIPVYYEFPFTIPTKK